MNNTNIEINIDLFEVFFNHFNFVATGNNDFINQVIGHSLNDSFKQGYVEHWK